MSQPLAPQACLRSCPPEVFSFESPWLYYLLSAYDPEFAELFKVKVDFGDQVARTPENIQAFARILATSCREEQLRRRPIHSKGVLIPSGDLGGRYAGRTPLSRSASIAFEQIYEEVEGDSASSAELYAILSSLSGLPLKQGLAVTGSVNQHGEVQAIGGVNAKIEGFFDVCKSRDLTGDHGVLIPASNVRHLMLREDVVEAIGQGAFHVYPVASIDEGIALLTGVAAGDAGPDGTYLQGTVNFLIQRRLRELAEQARAFHGDGGPPAARPDGT